jgi:hypothetical protein
MPRLEGEGVERWYERTEYMMENARNSIAYWQHEITHPHDWMMPDTIARHARACIARHQARIRELEAEQEQIGKIVARRRFAHVMGHRPKHWEADDDPEDPPMPTLAELPGKPYRGLLHRDDPE